MLFPTVSFAAFYAVVFVLSWLTRSHTKLWRAVILLASLFFYAMTNVGYALALAVVAMLNAWLADQIAHKRARWALNAALVLDLGLLATVKYLGFFASITTDLLACMGIHKQLSWPQFVLPLGVSFVSFQLISYVVDVWRKELEPAPWYDVLLYVSFFAHLVAGPIVRARDFIPQIDQPMVPDQNDRAQALMTIVAGLFKKVVIATYLARTIVDPVFAEPEQSSSLQTLVAVYGYAVQIYCDFSGYTDIAIGVALLLGVTFPQNFRQPYGQSSLQNFWRCWHITLSDWLRNYVYVALGGSRGSRFATYRNLVLTMILGGLWHGASMKFILWGALHGLWLALERILTRDTSRSKARTVINTIITFHVVCVGWILFRAADASEAFVMFRQLGSLTTKAPLVTAPVVLVIALGMLPHFVPASLAKNTANMLAKCHAVTLGVLLALALNVIDVLGPTGVAPFIYFQF